MPKHPTEIRSLARSYAATALRSLAALAVRAESETARVMACNAILDRAYGKAPQSITGENGEGGIEVIVRHLIERREPVGALLDLKKVEE